MKKEKIKEKPKKKAKTKKKIYKPFQSTQNNIPVDTFVNGMVLDKNGKFSMVMEVIPSPFFLKKTEERNQIGYQFQNFLKIAPSCIHIKSVSLPANLNLQITKAIKNIGSESSEECRKMGIEYVNHLKYAQSTGVMRRFFISFPYEGKVNTKDPDYINIVSYQMQSLRNRLEANLKSMGNDVVPFNSEQPNLNIASIFYTLLNRRSSLMFSFQDRCAEVYKRYHDVESEKDIYIPDSEFIAPSSINFLNSKYVECDGTYYTFLYIPSSKYPSEVYNGWLYPFINSFRGVDVDIFLSRRDRQSTMTSLKRSVGHAITDVYDNTNEVTDSFALSRQAYTSSTYLKNGLESGQDVYDMSTIITVSGQSIEEVNHNLEELNSMVKQMDMALETLWFQEETAFKNVLPLPYLDKSFYKKMHRNCLTEGAAACYPFLTFELIHDNGTYIADDSNSGTPVIPDFFRSDFYTNPHIFICGKTGAGKTVALQLMALRYRVKNVPVFILAPEKEHEFMRLCERIGGQFVSIGNDSKARLNIFDISVPSRKAREKIESIDGKDPVSDIFLMSKVTELLDFFTLFIPTLSRPEGMEQKQILNDAILETYYRFGINEDNDSIWADNYHRVLKTFPIMSDLLETLTAYAKKGSEAASRLAKIISMLTKGSGAHFNGHTNVDVNNKFFVVGLEHNTNEFFGLSIYLAMEFVWTKIKEDRSSEKVLIMDEWWKMAYNKVAAERTMQIARLARAEGCSLTIATQQMSDILAIEDGKYGNAILNSCSTKIIMQLEDRDISTIRDMVDLSNSECNSIKQFKKGEALMINGSNRMNIRFTPSETEKMLTFTDANTINKYAEISKKEKAEEEEKEAIKNAKSEDEIFVNAFDNLHSSFTNKTSEDDSPFINNQ